MKPQCFILSIVSLKLLVAGIHAGAFSFNIDPSTSKQFLRLHREEKGTKESADLAFLRRPAEELYDLRKDPHQLQNVANDPIYAKPRQRLRRKLETELIKSKDPRVAVRGYEDRTIEGWPVRISSELLKNQKTATDRALELLEGQLQTIVAVLPADALASVRTVPIWLSPKYDGIRPTGEYYPGIGWLKAQGRHLELHRCVEFTNIASFQRETKRTPMMVLHEMAHAYHDQVLGFGHPGIKAEYERAKKSGKYDAVRRGNGTIERAYAMTNHKEYFAESTEAFFGTNDFHPFNRTQLKNHDPAMFDLLSRIWNTGESDTAEWRQFTNKMERR